MTDPLTNPAFVLLSFLMPVIVSLVKQSGFADNVNALIALAVYVGAGILAAAWSGVALTVENMVPLCTTAVIVGTAAYQLFWSRIGKDSPDGWISIDDQLTRVTSVVK